jgi:hypothetical protein
MNIVYRKNTEPVKSLDLTANYPANPDSSISKTIFKLESYHD